MLRCKDNSIYTGITTDLERRMNEHFSKNEKCAKYTLRHTVKKLEQAWETENRQLSSILEYHIKKLKKSEKENLIKNPEQLEKVLGIRIDVSRYKLVTQFNQAK